MKDSTGYPLVPGSWYEHEFFSGNAYVCAAVTADETAWFGNVYVCGRNGLAPVSGGLARFRIEPEDAARMLPLGAGLGEELGMAG